MHRHWFSEKPDAQGYLHAKRYTAHPWYVKPTFLARWGPAAWATRIRGGVLPGDDGTKYEPQGYRLSDLGPDAWKGKGAEDMDKSRLKLRESTRLGCPYAAWRKSRVCSLPLKLGISGDLFL